MFLANRPLCCSLSVDGHDCDIYTRKGKDLPGSHSRHLTSLM